MLTITINPGGTAQVVTIAEALLHLGHVIRAGGDSTSMPPEERRVRKLGQQRAYRERVLARQPGIDR